MLTKELTLLIIFTSSLQTTSVTWGIFTSSFISTSSATRPMPDHGRDTRERNSQAEAQRERQREKEGGEREREFSLSIRRVCLKHIIIMEICKAPTLWLKALNKHTHIMFIDMENIIPPPPLGPGAETSPPPPKKKKMKISTRVFKH